MKKVTHAKMKPKQTQAIKELQQSAMLNEVALAAGVKMLMQIHPNDQDFGTAVRQGITKGMDITKINAQLQEIQSNTNQEEIPQTK
tara:strand:+ start:665 stop:922 length:258 start_codon:yes stop_codon:yes gene_type:complete